MTYNDLAKKYLIPPVYRRWVENTREGLVYSNVVYGKEINALAGIISGSFIWECSQEGDGYWRKLSRELNEKIRQGILQVSD
jgi:hypothetical protein